MTIPTWLARHLEATGQANQDGISRALRAGHCNTCQAPVLRGLDLDRCAQVATVQPTPVSVLGEALALSAGCHTWDLYLVPRPELHPREDSHIQGARARPVLAEHRCQVSWPVDLMPVAPTRGALPDVPAF